MPLSEPSGANGGLINNGTPLIIGGRLRTDLASQSGDNYSRCIFSPFSNRIFAGFANSGDGQIVAFDSVRSHGINFANAWDALGNVEDIKIHFSAGGGILLIDNSGIPNGAFRSSSEIPASATWTNITPPAATGRDSIFSLRNDPNLYIQTATLAGPARNIEISGDNGLTWDSNPGANIGFATGTGGLRTPIVGPGGNVFGCSNAGTGTASFGFIFNPANGVPGAGNFEINNLPGTMGTGDFNLEGTIYVTQSLFSVVVITPTGFTTIAADKNPFTSDNTDGEAIRCILFSPTLNGWLFMGNGVSPGTAGFMSADDLTEIIPTEFITNGASLAGSQRSAYDINGDVIALGNSLTCARTVIFSG